MEAASSGQDRPKVLIADDERTIADTLKIIVDQKGFEATAVYNGRQAIEAARIVRPDIFLSDVVMPEVNGIDAAIQIRAMNPACKVLLFSGQASTSDLLYEAHLRGYSFEILSKPVPPEELLARLREALETDTPQG